MSALPPKEAPATTEKAPPYKFAVMCIIFTGLVLTEQVSSILLPLTVRKFTPDASVIGWVKVLNPLFGFISQPLVGWLSDRTWTPFGRRAFFLIFGAPVVALSLWMAPQAAVLWHLIVWVVIWQCFQDVLWGSDHPLMADLFPPSQRPFLAALMATFGSLGHYLFLDVIFMEDHEQTYRIVAGLQLVMVVVFAFFLGERKPARVPPGKKWAFIPLHEDLAPDRAPLWRRAVKNVRWYAGEIFANSVFTRFAIINFTKFMAFTLVGEWVVLFGTETLQLTESAFKENWKLQPLVTLVAAVPVGWFIGRYCPKQWAMVAGFGLTMASCVLGYQAETASDLMVVAIIFALGNVVDLVAYKPFFTEFLPAAKIGMLTGAFNIFFGLGRSVSNLGGGYAIEAAGRDYRVIWIIAFFLILFSAILVATIPDRSYMERRAGRSG